MGRVFGSFERVAALVSGLSLLVACDRSSAPPATHSPPTAASNLSTDLPTSPPETNGELDESGRWAGSSGQANGDLRGGDQRGSGKLESEKLASQPLASEQEKARPLPSNYRVGVERVRELRDTIRSELAAERYDAADPPLHELAALLRALPRLADRESFADEERRQITRALDDLFHMFVQVDERLHGGFGLSYERLSDDIDAAIERLVPRAGPTR